MVVKVVILNWNGQGHLQTFLPSVVENTPKEYSVVIADNGSTDDSRGFVEDNFPSVEWLQLEKNWGFAEGYNRALAEIDADYYILLNSDVETPQGWCEPLIRHLKQNPQLGAISPKILSYSDKSKFEYAGASGGFIDILGYPFCRGRILQEIETDNGQYDTYSEVFWASGCCMAVPAPLFHEIGGFDETFFAHFEEIDLCWRMQNLGYSIAVEPQSKVYHLGGGTLPNNTPRKIYLNYRNNLSMLYKNLSKLQLFILLPIRMVLDGLSAAVFTLQGHFDFSKEVFKAHVDFYRAHGKLRKKRVEIQQTKVNKTRNILRNSLILTYFMGIRKFSQLRIK